jgi:type I restriction enzyme S subunit
MTKEKMEKRLFPLPPYEMQEMIADKLDKIMDFCNLLETTIQETKLKNKQLLQQFLSEAFVVEQVTLEAQLTDTLIDGVEDKRNKALILAAEIIWKLSQTQTLGHVKLQKMIYLCDRAQNMRLPVNFLRKAMGPYDRELQLYIDSELEQRGWFKYNEEEPLKYKMLKNAGGHKGDFKHLFQNDLEAIYHLIDIFENATSARIEIIGTLYACWEDMLKKKQLINDASLVAEFYNWSEHKSVYTQTQIIDALRWMEAQGVVPRPR